MFHTVARQHERRHRWAHQRAFGEAIKEVIEHHAGGDLTCFVGQPVVVEQHLVYPVIGIPTSIVKSVPTLERDTADDPRWKVAPSIVHAALEAVLAQALRALHLSDAGEAAEIGVGTDEILRFAIGRLGEAAVVLSGNEYGGSLADAMNRVCTMRYEQRVGVGRLVVAQRGCQGVDVDVTFRRPVSLRDTRTLRKLLELSDRDGPALLTDGDEVYGIGGVNDSYDTSSERAFDVTVAGDGTWELAHAITPLVTVKYGVPRLPEERLGKQRFTHVVQRVFGADIDADVDELWSLAVAASEAAHGTMIVVSLAAAEEADRLGSQALPVEPVRLASHLLGNVTEIDGAILVDPAGNCHGLGVILDGNAGDVGDRSRGARLRGRHDQPVTEPSAARRQRVSGVADGRPARSRSNRTCSCRALLQGVR